jgi:phage minor structural protein
MALGDLNYSLALPLPEMWLAKNDRTIVAKLDNRAGIGFSRFGHRTKFLKHTQLYKLNSINELEFSVPYQIEINHQLVRNPVVDQINESSLIKSVHNSIEEWFTVIDITKTMDADKDALTIQCRSLGYELIRRYVRNFKVVSQNLSSICLGGTTVDSNGNSVSFSGLLQGTLWGIASDTDATFDTIYRSVDISKATILDALIQVCKTFNAIMVFDTINRKISFQQLQNIGQDKGAKISYEMYMKSLQNESKTDLLVTRFVPYGKNGLTINAITGNSFIDDFSYFTNGFTRDANKNVLTHSPHMSDSLCGAIMDYITLQQAHSGDFTNLLNQLSSYQTTLTQQQNDLVNLNTTLTQIQNQLDIAQTTGQSTSSLLAQQAAQQALITAKQNDINTTNTNITNTNNSIASLQSLLSTNNNFTQAQQQELIPFIREAEWTDNNITDPQDLYNQALVQFAKYKTPQIVLTVDMTNIFEEITEQRVWDKFWIGNDVLIEYDVLGTSVKAKIMEMSFDHAEGNLAITVASVADLLRQEEQVWQMLYQSISAANIVSVNVDSWGQIDTVAKNVNAIYDNGIAAALINVNSGVGSTTKIDNRGFTSASSTATSNFIRINNGAMIFSADGGQTANVAIDSTGIYANKLVGQILIGANLLISNQSGSFSVDGNGVTVSGANLTITGKLPDNQIQSASTWNNAVQLGTAYNNTVISASDGIISTASNNLTRALMSGTTGFKIQKNINGTWTDQFYADGSGNLNVTGSINCTALSINGTSILNGNYISGNYIDSINANKINVGTLTGFTISAGTISGGTIVGASITGGSISSNTNINVTQDITLGSNLYLTNATNSSKQSIVAPGGSSIDFSGGLMTLSASSQVDVEAYFTYRNSEVATQSWVLSQGYTPSDIRLKKNIMEITHALEKIRSIRGVYFDWNMSLKENNDKENRRQFGVIAQEVERILPELIYSYKSNYKAVDYAKLTALLIEAIKELSDKVDDLSKPYKTN